MFGSGYNETLQNAKQKSSRSHHEPAASAGNKTVGIVFLLLFDLLILCS